MKKKKYVKPRIIAKEKIEARANACGVQGSGAKQTGCNTYVNQS